MSSLDQINTERTKVICLFIAKHKSVAHSVLTNNNVSSENVLQI